MSSKPQKTAPDVSAESVQFWTRTRFNPIRGLSPEKLSVYLDQWDAGYLNGMAQLMQKIEERDDTLVNVAAKRKKSVSRHGWEIVTSEETPAAQRQKEVLEAFFQNLTATSAVDEDVVGDVSLLIEQMMDAEGKRWAAHEIVWQPRGRVLTAEFRQVPLWFFEHTTSRLRFLNSPGQLAGDELRPGEWMVTRGSGLLVACAILYVFKHLPMKDLLNYCERYAIPGLHGQTDAAKGSDEWNALRDALAGFSIDWGLITNMAAKITPVDASAKGELPHPKIIERMDRMMSAIWRGADLSTMSAGGDASGASVQATETDLLEDSDIAMIESTLNRRVLPWVLRYALGDGEPLAEFRIQRPRRQDTSAEIQVDEFLLRAGCPVSITDLLERYGRPSPAAGEQLAVLQMPAAGGFGGFGDGLVNAPPRALPNSLLLANATGGGSRQAAVRELDERRMLQLLANAEERLLESQARDMQPLVERIQAALNAGSVEAGAAMLLELRRDLPRLYQAMLNESQTAQILEDTLAAALINGYVTGAVVRGGEAQA